MPLRAPDLRDGRSETRRSQRGPRDLRPGDEVILLSPYYFNHEDGGHPRLRRSRVHPVDERLQPDLPAIAAAITERTRAIVTVSPNNPTGAVYRGRRWRRIHRLCAERRGSTTSATRRTNISPTTAPGTSPPDPSAASTLISLYSLSKAYGMGELAGRVPRGAGTPSPRPHEESRTRSSSAGPAISQFVGLRAMREGRGYCASHLPSSRGVRKEVLARIAAIADLVEVPPATGAFYLFVKVNSRNERHRPVRKRLVREHQVAGHPRGDVPRDAGGAGSGSPTEACGRDRRGRNRPAGRGPAGDPRHLSALHSQDGSPTTLRAASGAPPPPAARVGRSPSSAAAISRGERPGARNMNDVVGPDRSSGIPSIHRMYADHRGEDHHIGKHDPEATRELPPRHGGELGAGDQQQDEAPEEDRPRGRGHRADPYRQRTRQDGGRRPADRCADERRVPPRPAPLPRRVKEDIPEEESRPASETASPATRPKRTSSRGKSMPAIA